jgi:hypothetical protein
MVDVPSNGSSSRVEGVGLGAGSNKVTSFVCTISIQLEREIST